MEKQLVKGGLTARTKWNGETGKYKCRMNDGSIRELWLFHKDECSSNIDEVLELIPGTKKEDWTPIVECEDDAFIDLLGGIIAQPADEYRKCKMEIKCNPCMNKALYLNSLKDTIREDQRDCFFDSTTEQLRKFIIFDTKAYDYRISEEFETSEYATDENRRILLDIRRDLNNFMVYKKTMESAARFLLKPNHMYETMFSQIRLIDIKTTIDRDISTWIPCYKALPEPMTTVEVAYANRASYYGKIDAFGYLGVDGKWYRLDNEPYYGERKRDTKIEIMAWKDTTKSAPTLFC